MRGRHTAAALLAFALLTSRPASADQPRWGAFLHPLPLMVGLYTLATEETIATLSGGVAIPASGTTWIAELGAQYQRYPIGTCDPLYCPGPSTTERRSALAFAAIGPSWTFGDEAHAAVVFRPKLALARGWGFVQLSQLSAEVELGLRTTWGSLYLEPLVGVGVGLCHGPSCGLGYAGGLALGQFRPGDRTQLIPVVTLNANLLRLGVTW